jgi:hypothetical protein
MCIFIMFDTFLSFHTRFLNDNDNFYGPLTYK